VNPALFFLLTRSLRGRLVRWLRLMKQPKYLIGFVVGISWFVLWFGSAFFGDSIRIESGRGFSMLGNHPIEERLPALYGGALALAAALSLWWLVPFG